MTPVRRGRQCSATTARASLILALALLLTSALLALAACGSSGTKPARPASSATVTVTAVPTPTVTVTATPSASAAPASASASSGASSTAPAVVSAYFAAINAHDYATAWALGGKNLGGSYAAFAAGFADTVRDDVQILAATDSTVTVRLTATETSGVVRVFQGTYNVAAGQITSTAVSEVAPATTSAAPVGPFVEEGAFCARSQLGATGVTKDGTLMHCTTTPSDPHPRWRHV